jgi:hypothetical protein
MRKFVRKPTWTRVCASCGVNKGFDGYSKMQWCKDMGVAVCKECFDADGRRIIQKPLPKPPPEKEGRPPAFTCDHLDHPIAEGKYRFIAPAMHLTGPRNGMPCVVKWFKSGKILESKFFEMDMKVLRKKAPDFLIAWNEQKFIPEEIITTVPAFYQFDRTQMDTQRGRRPVLYEPYIKDFQKFNSNTGWVPEQETRWSRIMQAVSHFSYHHSQGQYLLCDLQGGTGNFDRGIILVDPVVMSSKKEYGVTDLGADGISTFFSNHDCNEFCRDDWLVPKDITPYYDVEPGTEMDVPLSLED